MTKGTAALAAALLLGVAKRSGADGLPSVAAVVEEAARSSGAPNDRDAREAQLAAVLSLLWDIKLIPAVKLDCGGLPICPTDRIYYEQGSVDANLESVVSGLPDLIRSGRREAAAALIDSIRRSKVYASMAPRLVPFYPQYLVDAKLDAALSVLSGRPRS